jgi:hypothetical protein
MMYPVPSECPVCHDDLLVTELECRNCGAKVQGRFERDRISLLIPAQRHFVEVFILCEGKLNCVQEELGISYPTVRSRLDEIISALGRRVERPAPAPTPAPQPEPESTSEPERQEILDRLARKEISADEAFDLLENL